MNVNTWKYIITARNVQTAFQLRGCALIRAWMNPVESPVEAMHLIFSGTRIAKVSADYE